MVVGRPRGVRVVLGLVGSSLGCSRRPWAVRVVLGVFAWSLSSSGRPWVVLGVLGSSLGRSCRLLGVVVILGPSALSLSPAPVRLACCVTLLASAVRVVLWPAVSSFSPKRLGCRGQWG